MGTKRFDLIDDGTMDTVVKCSECDEEIRYNFATTEDETYDEFVDWCLEDAEETHECAFDTLEDTDA